MALLRSLLTLALLAATAGCTCGDDDDTTIDSGPVDGGPDGDLPDAADSAVDAGIPCARDEDCDDQVDCTVDHCDPVSLTCSIRPNDTLCANDHFCDGDERYSPSEGCVPGPSRSCSDDDVCTIDECDEATRACVHRDRDFDRDGHADWHCEGGDDCNDDDARIYGGAPEICGDLLDNDCNGVLDGEEPCVAPGYDTCDSPLEVSGGGAFELSLAGTLADYFPSCGWGATNDAVLTFTLEEESDVEITVESDWVLVTAALETECGANLSEVDCNWGFPAVLRSRALPAGTYYLIVQGSGAGDMLVVIDLSDPSPPPVNETCEGAIDVSAGGRWEGSFVDVANDLPVSCGYSYPELVYTFTIDETSDVDITATAGWNYIPMSVSTDCGNVNSEVRCSYSAPSHQHLYSLEPGTYFVLVEGSAEHDFTLDVAFGPPSQPPEGDLCDSAVDVSAGGAFDGTLIDRQDDVEISCGFAQADTVFGFDLADPKDVLIQVEGDGGEWMYVGIQGVCGETASESGCRYGNPAALRVRDLQPGSYVVVVESFSPTDFTLEVTFTDPAPPIAIDVADTCGEGLESPIEGGFFEGDTSEAANDYAASCGGGGLGPDEVVHFELLADARVTATLTAAGWRGVLHIHEGSCVGGADEIWCSEWWYFEQDLPPGDYYFVVDGAAAPDSGPYSLDLLILYGD